MIHSHSSTPSQRVQWVSELLAQEGRYGVVSQMSRSQSVSRQTLYTWKGRGQAVLEAALAPKQEPSESNQQLERAVLNHVAKADVLIGGEGAGALFPSSCLLYVLPCSLYVTIAPRVFRELLPDSYFAGKEARRNVFRSARPKI